MRRVEMMHHCSDEACYIACEEDWPAALDPDVPDISHLDSFLNDVLPDTVLPGPGSEDPPRPGPQRAPPPHPHPGQLLYSHAMPESPPDSGSEPLSPNQPHLPHLPHLYSPLTQSYGLSAPPAKRRKGDEGAVLYPSHSAAQGLPPSKHRSHVAEQSGLPETLANLSLPTALPLYNSRPISIHTHRSGHSPMPGNTSESLNVATHASALPTSALPDLPSHTGHTSVPSHPAHFGSCTSAPAPHHSCNEAKLQGGHVLPAVPARTPSAAPTRRYNEETFQGSLNKDSRESSAFSILSSGALHQEPLAGDERIISHKKSPGKLAPDHNNPTFNINAQHGVSVHAGAGHEGHDAANSDSGMYRTDAEVPSRGRMGGKLDSYYDNEGYHNIQFTNFQVDSWCPLFDSTFAEIRTPSFEVFADKGFTHSAADEAYVSQKKNHLQISVQTTVSATPQFVKASESMVQVSYFRVNFYGVKSENTEQMIKVEQSQSDRSKKTFYPRKIELVANHVSKDTVGRLHFAETTQNNMRKKGKPNPEQKFFRLVAALEAVSGDAAYSVVRKASGNIIVRASNPGQFESDAEHGFQRGAVADSLYHLGSVGINTDRPDAALTVLGDVRISGQVLHPSDGRAKTHIKELDTQEQLRNVQSLRVVSYKYRDEFAEPAHIERLWDTGVIAQEVEKVLPEAVGTKGDLLLADGNKIENFLVVNKDRLYMENVGAVKELCKVTDNLENRIDELEKISHKISQIKRQDSHRSCGSVASLRSYGGVSGASQGTARPCPAPGGVARPPHLAPPPASQKGSSRSSKTQGPAPPQGDASSVAGAAEQCSNKSLQLVTIVLVCVMALCLVSMAILYVVDYLERRSEDLYTSTELMEVVTTVSFTTSIPLNFSSSHFSSSTATTGRSVSPRTDTTPASSTLSPYQPVRPPVLGRPPGCASVVTDSQLCTVHCCPTADSESWWRSPLITSTSLTASADTTTTTSTTFPYVVHSHRTQESSLLSLELQSGSSLDSALITNKLSTSDPDHSSTDVTEQETIHLKPLPSKKTGSPYGIFSRHRVRSRPYRPSSTRKIKQTISKRDLSVAGSSSPSSTTSFPISSSSFYSPLKLSYDASLQENRLLRDEGAPKKEKTKFISRASSSIRPFSRPGLADTIDFDLNRDGDSMSQDQQEEKFPSEVVLPFKTTSFDGVSIYDGVTEMYFNDQLSENDAPVRISKMERRSIDVSSLPISDNGKSRTESGVCNPVITIVEFDTIITHLYCLNTTEEVFNDCMSSSSGNKSYGIPVSKFMNNLNLTLTFEFPFSECEVTPSYCNPGNSTEYPPELCVPSSLSEPSSGPAVVHESARQLLLADVGLWKRVAYPFRIPLVGSVMSDMNICSLPSSDVGVTYVEYNVFFYRVCDE